MPELQIQRHDDLLTITLNTHTSTVPWSEISLPHKQMWSQIYQNAAAYGQRLFAHITHNDALRAALLALRPTERLTLVCEQPEVALILWEYLRDPNNRLLASRLNFVRYVPGVSGSAGTEPNQSPLTLLAIPAAPVHHLHQLNTEREWNRLIDVVKATARQLSLVRVRPPALASLEEYLPAQGQSIIHFMGHSGLVEGKSVLEFEDHYGNPRAIPADYFAEALNESVFLIVLNSCLSALPVPTEFGNIAHSLVRQGIPYAFGMQYVLPDDAALELSRTFYQHLLQGRTVEESVRRTRRAIEEQSGLHRPLWIAGIPVLYTHLREPAAPLNLQAGPASVRPDPERLQQLCDLTALPRAAHFIGRSQEIGAALKSLLAPDAHGFVLLHGLGGIGKTSLAAVLGERASWYYQDNVLAYSFETFITQDQQNQPIISETFAERFYARLAHFCQLNPAQYPTTLNLQQAILQRRMHSRSLLILDNMETLIEAQKSKNPRAQELATFISRLKEGNGVILLTSRSIPPSDWGDCTIVSLSGLSLDVAAELFHALLPEKRQPFAPKAMRLKLAERVQGHPLGIRLLAGRFAEETTRDLEAFLVQIEEELKLTEQKTPTSLEDPQRQKTLYACINYSVQYLTDEQKQVLHACSLFQSVFLPSFVQDILKENDQIANIVQNLIRLGLIESKTRTFPEGTVELLELHSILRWYIQYAFPEISPEWQHRYSLLYKELARQSYKDNGYSSNALLRFLIRQSLTDLESALLFLTGADQSALAFWLARPYTFLGQNRRALRLYELALEIDQEAGDARGVAATQNALADVLVRQGKIEEGVRLYEEALKTKQELGDVREVAVTQYSLANVLVQQGKIEEGVRLYEESLKTYQEIGDIRSIAVTQNALANVLVQQGKIEEAMRLYELSLKTKQELGDVREVAVTKVTLGRLLWQQNMQSQALSDIWQAYVSLIQIGYLPDAEAVRNTLISIKVTDIAHFNTIWEGVMNIPQPEWLDQVQPSPSNNELPPITDEIIQAVNEFVNTQDWEATHQILLQQQPLLLSPEVERLFEHNIALALQKQNQRFADMLTIHLSLLRACKQMGVEAAWTQFQSSFT